MQIQRLSALLLLSIAASSCASENPYKEKYERLSGAYAQLEAGDLPSAALAGEQLLADTNDDKDMFLLQRFFATYVVTQAHQRGSLGQPFLRESTSKGGGVIASGGGGAAAAAGTQPSPTAHVVASIYHADKGLDTGARAGTKPTSFEGQRLLPEDLEGLGVDNAIANLGLATLVAYGRLNFTERAGGMLGASPALLRLDSCEALLEAAHVPAGARAWVYLLAHEYLTRADQLESYKFGIRSLEVASKTPDALPADRLGEIKRWITSGASYTFVCPQCQSEVTPELGACINDGTPNVQFLGQPKAPTP